jgi:hypothetical protein
LWATNNTVVATITVPSCINSTEDKKVPAITRANILQNSDRYIRDGQRNSYAIINLNNVGVFLSFVLYKYTDSLLHNGTDSINLTTLFKTFHASALQDDLIPHANYVLPPS